MTLSSTVVELTPFTKTRHCFVFMSCAGSPCFNSSDGFLICLSFHQPPGLCLSSSPLFFLFLRPCLIHARMPAWSRAFVHGHAFLHSWSGPMILVVGLLHGAAFLSNFTLVLFVSFIWRVFYRTLAVGKDAY